MAEVPPERDASTWRVGLAHFEGLAVAALATDREGRVVFCNGSAEALFGYAGRQLLDHALLELIVPADERGGAAEIIEQALAGRGWRGEFPLLCPGDEVRLVQLTCSPLALRDTLCGVLWVVQSGVAGPAAANAHQRGERLTRLARVNAELVAAENVEAVTNIVISHAADAAGATVASLSLVDEDTLVLAGIRGGRSGVASRWASFPVSAHTPAGDAVRSGQPVILNGRDAIRSAYPDMERAAGGQRSIICLPLRIAHRSIGAISLSFPGRENLDAAELEFFGILADTCAQALERLRAVADAKERRAKLRFLADASAELATSLDYQATLRNVAELAVPDFADWCAIALAQDGDLRTLSVAHVDPAMVAAASELQERYPPDRDAPQGTWHVFRTGRSELLPEITDEMLVAGTQDAEHLQLCRELDLRSALVVPLYARGEVLGVMSWVRGSRASLYDRADLTFAEDVGHRVAVAIDNAQLHSEVLDAAVRLQRAVLPETLKAPPGWELAAHYSPAGRTEVGGDFYDVMALDDQRLVVYVGDVMGRGVSAAAAMAQTRAAVRAYAAVDPAPSVVMSKMDTMFATYDLPQMVTLVYLVADPATDELEVANAGHPPPIVRRGNGTIEQLAHAGGPPLGTGDATRTSVRVPFCAGDTLLAFTDGLVERRTEDIDRGLARLAGQGQLLGSDGLEDALELLVEEVRDHTLDDDVAALAVRRT